MGESPPPGPFFLSALRLFSLYLRLCPPMNPDAPSTEASALPMKASAIIVAAGSGTRLGFDRPKAFVELSRTTLLAYSLRTIAAGCWRSKRRSSRCPQGCSRGRAPLIKDTGLEIPVKLTPGGAERQDSVRIALELTSSEAEMVIVHDAARPFATPAIFEAALAAAERCGGAIAAIPSPIRSSASAMNPRRSGGRTLVRSSRRLRAPIYGRRRLRRPFAAILLQAHRRPYRTRSPAPTTQAARGPWRRGRNRRWFRAEFQDHYGGRPLSGRACRRCRARAAGLTCHRQCSGLASSIIRPRRRTSPTAAAGQSPRPRALSTTLQYFHLFAYWRTDESPHQSGIAPAPKSSPKDRELRDCEIRRQFSGWARWPC